MLGDHDPFLELPPPPVQCANCGRDIRVGNITMTGPEFWVHDPGGFWLCIINGIRTGTHAEPVRS